MKKSTELTGREREVLRLIAQGNTTKEVASKLGITENTAAAHRFNVMRKSDTHNTAQLVAYAVKSGIVRLHAEVAS